MIRFQHPNLSLVRDLGVQSVIGDLSGQIETVFNILNSVVETEPKSGRVRIAAGLRPRSLEQNPTLRSTYGVEGELARFYDRTANTVATYQKNPPTATDTNWTLVFQTSGDGGGSGGVTFGSPIAVNVFPNAQGTLTTSSRSDHKHYLDESIEPYWSSKHTFLQNNNDRSIYIARSALQTSSALLGVGDESQNVYLGISNGFELTLLSETALRTPLQITAAASQTAPLVSIKDSLSNIKSVVDYQGDVGIGTDTPDAHLTVQGRGPSEADIFSLNPVIWLDAADPEGTGTHSYTNGSNVVRWCDTRGAGYPSWNGGPTVFPTWWAGGATQGSTGDNRAPFATTPVLRPAISTLGSQSPSFADRVTYPSDFSDYVIFAVAQSLQYTLTNTVLGSDRNVSPARSGSSIEPCVIVDGADNVPARVVTGPGTTSQGNFNYTSDPVTGATYNTTVYLHVWKRVAGSSPTYQFGSYLPNNYEIVSGDPANAPLRIQHLLKTYNSAGSSNIGKMSIHELLVFRSLTPTQETLVRNYIRNKYGVDSGVGITGTGGRNLTHWKGYDGNRYGTMTNSGWLGLGLSVDPTAPLHLRNANVPQSILDIDDTNYLKTYVNSSVGVVLEGSEELFTILTHTHEPGTYSQGIVYLRARDMYCGGSPLIDASHPVMNAPFTFYSASNDNVVPCYAYEFKQTHTVPAHLAGHTKWTKHDGVVLASLGTNGRFLVATGLDFSNEYGGFATVNTGDVYGTQIGAFSNLLSFYGKTPVPIDDGWTISPFYADNVRGIPENATVSQLADTVNTIIHRLYDLGLID